MKILIILVIFLVNNTIFGQITNDLGIFVKTLGWVESRNNDLAIGDGGKAISRYQIHYNCYLDAKNYDKSITFLYNSLTNKENAAKIVIAYITRYCPKGTYEDWARLWNSGPHWKNKTNLTNTYVNRFKKALNMVDGAGNKM